MKRFIIIIPIGLKEKANNYCQTFADGGEYTFTIELSENGLQPASHTICNWFMNNEEETKMKKHFLEYMIEAEDNNDTSILENLKLKKIKKECKNCQ